MIPAPTVLATLPAAGRSQDCEFRTAKVQSLGFGAANQNGQTQKRQASIRRRYRSEMVVACPSGAIQIYDIRSARQITSYVSPPGSGFVCDPVSVLLRSEDTSVKRRITVGALRAPTRRGKGKIVLWEERIGRDVPFEDKIRMFQQELEVEDIVRLDITLRLGPAGSDEYQTIAIGRHGRLASWNEQLQDDLIGDSPIYDDEVRDAFLIGIEQAKEGILKNRDDVTAVAAARGLTEMLVYLTASSTKLRKETQTLSLQIHGLSSKSTELVSSSTAGQVVALASVILPGVSASGTEISSCHFYNSGSLLFTTSSDHISIFDLSRTIPMLKATLRIPQLCGITPISESIVAITGRQFVHALDTKYNAILASRELSLDNKLNGIPNGDGHAHTESEGYKLVAFFPETGTLGALHGNNLVTLQVEGDDAQERPHKKLKHATLADAVGRGLGVSPTTLSKESGFQLSSEIGVPETPSPLHKSWEADSKRLERLASEGNGKEFDKLARKSLGVGTKSEETIIHPRKVDLVLSLIFAVVQDAADGSRDSAERTLKLLLWPGKTMEHLGRQRVLSQSNIEEAMKRTGKLVVVEHLHPTAVVSAVAHANAHTMKKLKALLHTATSLNTREVLCAIRLALQRLQQQQNLEQMQLLTSGPAEDKEEGAMEQDESAAAPTRKHIPFVHDVIRVSLDRLQVLHPSTYASAIAAEFSPSDLFALIDYLRLALAQRGWFARHVDPIAVSSSGSLDMDVEPSDELGAPNPGLSATGPDSRKDKDKDPLTQSAQLAVTLLNVALDTLGTQGWLLTDPRHAGATLGHMRAEVAAALEGVQEAAYLHGLLAETLRFAGTVPQQAITIQQQQEKQQGLGQAGKPMVLETAVASSSEIDEARALPLGMRYVAGGELDNEALSRHKSGGEILRRSARDVGRLKSMRVGVHTFERIVL